MSAPAGQTFTIRRAFLWPLGMLAILLLTLLLVGLRQGQPPVKSGLLALMLILVGTLFVSSLGRRLVLESDRLLVCRLGRCKSLELGQLTAADSVQVRKRIFLTLCAGEQVVILSNAYRQFSHLVQNLILRMPAHLVTERLRQLAAAPQSNRDILSCWIAVAVVAAILWHQVQTGF